MKLADESCVKSRFTRLFAACAAVVALVSVISVSANAGTLTSASFTTNGTGYAVTNASNSRYDWRYTTATAGTTSRVETTVPAGTKPTGAKYLALSGVTGLNYASTPDSVANSISGDLDIRAQVAFPASGSPSSYGLLVNKFVQSGNQRSFQFLYTNTGKLEVNWSTSGSDNNYQMSSSAVSATANQPIWLRGTLKLNNGSSQSVATFYTSVDGINWTQLGSPVTGGLISNIFDSNSPIELGSQDLGFGSLPKIKIYDASIASGITGTTTTATSTCTSTGVVACFNALDYGSGTTFISSSSQAEQWTINRYGSNFPADIASDLSVAELSGLPPGGAASYRLIDNRAVYVLPTATSIAAGTATLLALSGFTNTATAGSYSSTITTFDNSGTPVAIDSVTTGALAFADLANSATVGVAVDPTFSFTVSTHAGACNSVAQTAGVTSGPTGVALGRVTSGAGSIAAQDLSIGTNANTGFSLQMRTSGPLTAGSNTIANAPGTNASPAAFPAATTAAFGYTVSGLSRFAGTWAGPETINREVMNASTVGTVTNCIAYRVQVTASTPAGSYSSTAYYTAVPSF